MIFVAAVVLIGIAGTVSGKGCCTPDQWQGYQFSSAGYNGKKPGFVESGVFISYDATNKQVAAKATYTKNGKDRKYNIVVRYEKDSEVLRWCSGENCEGKGKMFILDEQNDKCFVKKLRKPFRKMCIPKGAKSPGNFRFGAGNSSLEVEAFNMKRFSRKRNVFVESWMTVTKDGCIPVTESLHGAIKGVGFMENVGFADISPGIKDPAVFDIPKQCEEKNVSDAPFPDDIIEHEFSMMAF